MARYKRDSKGYYRTTVRDGYHDDGRIKNKTIYGKTIKDLEEKITDYKLNNRKSKRIMFGKYADMWLKSKRGLAPATYNGYLYALKHTESLTYTYMDEITRVDLQKLIDSLPGRATQTKVRICLQQIFELAEDDNLIISNPTKHLQITASKEQPKKRALTEEEKEALKRIKLDTMVDLYIKMLYFTGMRRGEVLALTVDDIDIDNNLIYVRKSASYPTSNKAVIKEPKTKNSVRAITMPKALKDVLFDYLFDYEGNFLFSNNGKEVVSYSTMRRMWERFLKSMSKELDHECDLTPHIFRHNYATMLYYLGVDVKEAQRLLGHSKITTTLEIYTHLSPTSTSEVVHNLTL